MTAGIQVNDLEYTYPKTSFAVSAPAFLLNQGECIALQGKNGTGKTTFGKLVSGLIKPVSGDILLDGESILNWSLGKIGSKVGYLFQEPSKQIFAPTVLEELTFVPKLLGVLQQEAEERALEMLNRFEMRDLENANTYVLSRGEKQRLAIAAMLLGGPKYLVLDEPTTGLDERRRKILQDTLRSLKADNIGILLISHDDSFVEKLSDSVIHMDGGVLVG